MTDRPQSSALRQSGNEIDARKPGDATAHRYWVGTFPGHRPGRKPHAYLRDYNAAWEGCVVYSVLARTGKEAKRAAIEARAAALTSEARFAERGARAADEPKTTSPEHPHD